MREGCVFRQCTRCRRRVTYKDRRCPACDHDRFTWGYTIDLAPPGSPRDQRKKMGFASKSEALADMNRAQAEKAEGIYVKPSRLTLGDYLQTWVAGGCGGVRPWTLRGYESVIRVHIVPRLGRVPIQQLTRPHIRALYEELRTSGYVPKLTSLQLRNLEDVAERYRLLAEVGAGPPVPALVQELGRPEATVRSWVRRCRELGLLSNGEQRPSKPRARGLSAKTVWNVHICLRTALNDAIEDGLIRTNPAKGALKEPTNHKEMKTWTVEELRAFLDFVRDDRNYALYRLAAYSGMRRGELLGLRWKDVKFHLGSASVQQQLGYGDDEDDVDDDATEVDAAPVLVAVKSKAGRRSISLDDLTLAALQNHRAAQELERRAAGHRYRDHDLVFCRPHGTAHEPSTISRQFERRARRRGLKRIRFHDLRHTHATLLLEAGVDITVVSRRLGHANVQITAERYAHVTAKLQYDAAARFSTLLDGALQPPATPGECDPVVTPLPKMAPNDPMFGADLNTKPGSGARIRTVNLAVNSRLLYR